MNKPIATHKCSFCDKSNTEIEGVMVAGPGVAICQYCVFECIKIIFECAKPPVLPGKNGESHG